MGRVKLTNLLLIIKGKIENYVTCALNTRSNIIWYLT